MTTPMVPVEVNTSEATRSITSRTTKGGRRLHYELTCLQQPERARACGSGQKSAADRRPVDPPPVVQLRVLEGPTLEDSKDITLSYPANFFVFVDLQHARPMANGRVQTPAATSPPVLTGSPVSGMAYLDRPAEAGYFLFPDLSVRHEGRYVLGFSLYEELKDDQDQDLEPADDDATQNFYLRMHVLSAPFVVFSAKKFPGLTSSTDLSRCISEQGCRVRIRRDVRMRRRDGKPSAGDFDKDDEARRRRTQTPDLRKDPHRGRSDSNSSEHRVPYPSMHDRRPSEVDAYPPPPPGPAPHTHMRYGSDASNPGGYAPQYIQPAPPPISPSSAHYSGHSGHPSPYTAAPVPPAYGYQSRPPPPQPYSTTAPSTPRDVYDRRSSAATVPPSPSHSHFASKDDYRRDTADYNKLEAEPLRLPEPRKDSQTYSSAPISVGASAPEPLKLPPIGASTRPPPPPVSSSGYGPSPVGSSHMYPPPPPQAIPDYIEPATEAPAPAPESVRAGSKRAFNDTFAENTGSLYDRQRPKDPYHSNSRVTFCDPDGTSLMRYVRADGTRVSKTPNTFYLN